MAVYSIAQRGVSGASGNPQWEIRTAITDRPRLYELGVSLTTGTASVFGLGRASAIGIIPSNILTFLSEDTADPVGTVTAATTWGTAPLAPTNWLRRFEIAGVQGNTAILTFPRGLLIPISSSLVVWNIGTNAVCDFWAVVEE